jgi:hypothetical protein
MKKLLMVLALVVMAGLLLTACSSVHSCPAYGKVHKTVIEQPS